MSFIEIKSAGTKVEVFLDGQEVKDITRLELVADADHIRERVPLTTLNLFTNSAAIAIEAAVQFREGNRKIWHPIETCPRDRAFLALESGGAVYKCNAYIFEGDNELTYVADVGEQTLYDPQPFMWAELVLPATSNDE